VNEVFDDAQVRERAYFVEHEHPDAGVLTVPGAPFQMDGTPWSLRRPAPRLGEHNEEVYCGLLGVRKEDLGILSGSRVI
jgi:crotonobetainyl-CoA:carnitine CoA-transferase CaiB-like acyl-CoA transferase